MARTRQSPLLALCVTVALLDSVAAFHVPLSHAISAKSHVRRGVMWRCSHEHPPQEGLPDSPEHFPRRDLMRLLASSALISSVVAPSASFAQKPPPRPKATSIPEECRQVYSPALAL